MTNAKNGCKEYRNGGRKNHKNQQYTMDKKHTKALF